MQKVEFVMKKSFSERNAQALQSDRQKMMSSMRGELNPGAPTKMEICNVLRKPTTFYFTFFATYC